MSARHVIEAPRALFFDEPHGEAVLAPARITVDGARILSVDLAPTTPPPPDADVLPDRFVLAPAFVDAHTHLALHVLRGSASTTAAGGNLVEDLFFRVETAMTADDVRAFSRVGALEALLGGTAVVHDHYYFADAVAEALLDVGLAGLVGPALQDLAGPGRERWEASLELTAQIDDDPRLAEAGIGTVVAPHATDTVSDALWERILTMSDRRGLPVHVHVAQSLDEVRRAVEAGDAGPFDRMVRRGLLTHGASWLLVHNVFSSHHDAVFLDERHTLVACPRSWSRFAFPADVRGWRSPDGARIAVGSDAAASNDALQVQSELPVLASWATASVRDVVPEQATPLASAEAWWTERQARWQDRWSPASLLRMITDTPGRVHPRLKCGALAPGHLAHLALWDTWHPAMWPGDDVVSALVHGSPQGALAQLMVAGRWLGERGAGAFQASLLARQDVQHWLVEATQRRDALLRRALG